MLIPYLIHRSSQSFKTSIDIKHEKSLINICNTKWGKKLVVRTPEGGKKLFNIAKTYCRPIFSHRNRSMKTTNKASQDAYNFLKNQYFRMFDLSNPLDAYPRSKILTHSIKSFSSNRFCQSQTSCYVIRDLRYYYN